ncbi:pentapeptide repeat-containing protein [Camelimonas sp. ID_303_24]
MKGGKRYASPPGSAQKIGGWRAFAGGLAGSIRARQRPICDGDHAHRRGPGRPPGPKPPCPPERAPERAPETAPSPGQTSFPAGAVHPPGYRAPGQKRSGAPEAASLRTPPGWAQSTFFSAGCDAGDGCCDGVWLPALSRPPPETAPPRPAGASPRSSGVRLLPGAGAGAEPGAGCSGLRGSGVAGASFPDPPAGSSLGTSLAGASLAGVSLTGVSLAGVALAGASLPEASLAGASFDVSFGATGVAASLPAAFLPSAGLPAASLPSAGLPSSVMPLAILARIFGRSSGSGSRSRAWFH